MKKDVLDKNHIKKNDLGFKLYDMFPEYFIPEYIMISFTNINYHIVKERSYIQNEILDQILSYEKIPRRETLKNIKKKKLRDPINEKNS